MEVIIVDNQSTDGSLEYLRPKFPCVTFIRSKANLGFARACNFGLEQASGDHILFLNPDTIVAEDTLEKCLHFFQQHPEAGALGVRMLDGTGRFLKESKRAFPSPLTSLFKLLGLSSIFPGSRVFSRYYLGHLDEHQNHKVDVLAGAFMMIRKDVLQNVGSFDKAFFMYGEDIDLSYRIQKAGYHNYYLADTEIIHFKGESTKRGSLNYVRMFYHAMSIFVHKHYGGAREGIFRMAIHFAIWVRAFVAALAKLVRWIGLPLIDGVIILISFWVMKGLWVNLVKGDDHYPQPLLWIAFPAFTVIYLVVGSYTGLYNKIFRRRVLLRSCVIATLVLLAAYALLPSHLRFSRGIVLFGSLLSFVFIYSFRLVLMKWGLLQHPPHKISKPYILIAGSEQEYEEVKHILEQQKLHNKIIDRLEINEGETETTIRNIESIALASNARELIICAGQTSVRHILDIIQSIRISKWFHMAGTGSIVGSDQSYTSGEVLSAEEHFNLAQPHHRRAKRLVDILVALLLLSSFPFHFLVIKDPARLFKNCINVLRGRKTWIGYQAGNTQLPPLRKGVMSEMGRTQGSSKVINARLDYWYARNYEPLHDVRLIIKNYRYLDS